LGRRAFQFTHFARQRWPSELNNGSIGGNVAAESGERSDNSIFADHRGFDYLSRCKAHDQRDNRACREEDVCRLTSGLEQNLFVL
jgi:hypothetical protein